MRSIYCYEITLIHTYIHTLDHYRKNWKGDAERWVRFGRLDVLELNSDTNNLVETHFRRLKYTDSNGKVCRRLHGQILMLLEGINGFTLKRRLRLNGGG